MLHISDDEGRKLEGSFTFICKSSVEAPVKTTKTRESSFIQSWALTKSISWKFWQFVNAAKFTFLRKQKVTLSWLDRFGGTIINEAGKREFLWKKNWNSRSLGQKIVSAEGTMSNALQYFSGNDLRLLKSVLLIKISHGSVLSGDFPATWFKLMNNSFEDRLY